MLRFARVGCRLGVRSCGFVELHDAGDGAVDVVGGDCELDREGLECFAMVEAFAWGIEPGFASTFQPAVAALYFAAFALSGPGLSRGRFGVRRTGLLVARQSLADPCMDSVRTPISRAEAGV